MSDNEKFEQEELAKVTSTPAAPAKETAAKKDNKDAKPAKKKDGPGFFGRIARWVRELRSELRKVQWPTWKQTLNNTLIVIICVLVVGVFIWAFDWLARLIVEALLNLAGTL